MSAEPNVILWVAWMARWDEPFPTFAYSVGVFDSPTGAMEAGRLEEEARGSKYGFQHAPCQLDMIKPPVSEHLAWPDESEPPTQVLLCWVTKKSLSMAAPRCHLVGLFTAEEKAKAWAEEVYPGWRLETAWVPVIKGGAE